MIAPIDLDQHTAVFPLRSHFKVMGANCIYVHY